MFVLSLFDGISCGRAALEKAGVYVDAYYASEIDKYAVQVAEDNWSDITEIGDVTKVYYKDGILHTECGDFPVPKIDMVIGGSPCQGFSNAGKRKNFEDPRSRLFWEFVRILKETGPEYFLLENVSMKQEWADVISKALGVEPILIDSALVSAATRKRLYWTNIGGGVQSSLTICRSPLAIFGNVTSLMVQSTIPRGVWTGSVGMRNEQESAFAS